MPIAAMAIVRKSIEPTDLRPRRMPGRPNKGSRNPAASNSERRFPISRGFTAAIALFVVTVTVVVTVCGPVDALDPSEVGLKLQAMPTSPGGSAEETAVPTTLAQVRLESVML